MPVKFSEKLLPNSIDEASNITHHIYRRPVLRNRSSEVAEHRSIGARRRQVHQSLGSLPCMLTNAGEYPHRQVSGEAESDRLASGTSRFSIPASEECGDQSAPALRRSHHRGKTEGFRKQSAVLPVAVQGRGGNMWLLLLDPFFPE
jgi:hypothetical protein